MMRNHRLRVLTLTALLTALLTVLPNARADNLVDVYRLALQNDNAWSAAQNDYHANLEKDTQGRSLLMPNITAGANYYKNELDSTLTSPVTGSVISSGHFWYDSKGYTLQLVQPLFREPAFAAYSQGKIAVTQAEAQLALARQDLILRTAQAYFDVLAAQDTLEFARSQKAAIKGQYDLSRRNFEVGNATIVDVHAAQARYDIAAAQEVSADSDLQVKQEALATITNSPIAVLAPLAPKMALAAPAPADPEEWVKAATDQNLQIKVQESLLSIAEQEVSKNRGGHYPTLDLVAARIYSDAGASVVNLGIESTTNQVGLQLNVPIYQGGYVQSKMRESVARREQARDNLSLARRQTTRQTREAYLAVTSGGARVQALEQALVSTQKALDSTLIGYESGVRTGVDVLNAQSDVYRTKNDLSQARYAYIVSRLRLKAAVGTLNDGDLGEANALLAAAPAPAGAKP